MPRQSLGVRFLIRALRHLNGPAMHRVVVSAIFKFVSYPTAHLEMAGRCDRDVASIKQAMNVAAKQKPICRFVLTMFRIRSNVRCIQRRERPLSGDGTTPLIIISHYDSKRALPQTRLN